MASDISDSSHARDVAGVSLLTLAYSVVYANLRFTVRGAIQPPFQYDAHN
jgi:hypothetical protein